MNPKNSINETKASQPPAFMHPWELDPDQPRVDSANLNSKSCHYYNLDKTYSRLRDLMADFDYCKFVACTDYLDASTDLRLE